MSVSMESVTDQKIKDLEPRFKAYLIQGGSPEPGSERYNYLIRVFFFSEGSMEGLRQAKEILNA